VIQVEIVGASGSGEDCRVRLVECARHVSAYLVDVAVAVDAIEHTRGAIVLDDGCGFAQVHAHAPLNDVALIVRPPDEMSTALGAFKLRPDVVGVQVECPLAAFADAPANKSVNQGASLDIQEEDTLDRAAARRKVGVEGLRLCMGAWEAI
jgi:hypothetical protein